MAKTPEEIAAEVNGKIEGFKTQLENAVSKEDLQAAVKDLNEFKDGLKGLDAAKLQADLDEAFEKIAKLEEGTNPSNVEKKFSDEVIEKMNDIKEIVKGDNLKEVVIKANTTRASIAGNTNALRLPDIGQLGVKLRSLYDIFPKLPVSVGDHNGVIKYVDWDEASIVRAAAAVAEGAAFAESTAAFQEYSIPLRKIGDTLPVTEEFGEDSATAAAELEMFLDTNVNSVIDNQIAVGPGTGQTLTGLVTSAPAYTPVASGIADANIYDLVKKVKTDITKNRGSKYSPDFVAMNSDTADRLHLKKDANNNYIFPDVNNIGQMMIVEDNNLADNTLVVGDRRFGKIYEMSGVELSRGLVNAQFNSDLQTIKARKRLLFLIREVDKTGFRKVTDITAALTTLAT